MNSGIRILTEDEFNKMSVGIPRRVQMSDVAYYFSGKNMKMAYEPYLLETGSVPKIVKNDGIIHEFKALKMGRKFDVDLQGRVVAVPNYNFEMLKKIGIRPVIPLSMIPESIIDEPYHISYGYYPISILARLDQDLITNRFLSSSYNNLYSINLKGNSYHAIEVDTFPYGTKKYINLLEHNQKFDNIDFQFVTTDNIKYMWAELNHIEWTIDRNLGLAIADFIPMTDIEFNDTFYYKSFKDTKLYKWLNSEFLDTIMMFENEKLIIPKKNNKKKEEVVNENNNLFAIDLSNFSFNDIDALKNNRKKELGIDEESIKEFKKEIKTVTEEEAENLGKELFEKVFTNDDENYDKIPDFIKALRLIKAGANVNFRNNNDKGNFPLIMCASGNYPNTFMALFLIKAGADVNMSNSYGITPLMAAARHGNKEILEILILMGADVNIKDYDGNTALSLSTLSSQREITKMLVEAGAYLNSTNLKGQNTFEHKQKQDNFDVDDLFFEASAMLDEVNNDKVATRKNNQKTLKNDN